MYILKDNEHETPCPVPCRRRLVAGLSQTEPTFGTRRIYCVQTGTGTEQVFLHVLRFCPVSIRPPALHTFSFITDSTILAVDSVVKQHSWVCHPCSNKLRSVWQEAATQEDATAGDTWSWNFPLFYKRFNSKMTFGNFKVVFLFKYYKLMQGFGRKT
jgi:hypothetical protein